MRSIFFVVIAAVLVGCATTRNPVDHDPIDQLVTNLSASHGLWRRSSPPVIKLPATASTKEVVAKALEGQVASCKILKGRPVLVQGTLPELTYTAALVQTNVGKKIVIFRYEEEAAGWRTWIFDVKPSA
jgi:hypothetical protein